MPPDHTRPTEQPLKGSRRSPVKPQARLALGTRGGGAARLLEAHLVSAFLD